MDQKKVILPLYGYEQRFMEDRSRLKLWLKARQIGGSTTATLDIVLDAVTNGEDWHTMSRSQRQAKKLLLKAKKHVRAINRWSAARGLPPVADESEMGTETITFRNGASISAVPCDPDTTVGETSNWLLDEFSLFPDSHRLYAIIKPSIMHGKRMIVLFTPRGKESKGHDMVQDCQAGTSGFSFHRTTIKEAFNDGLVLYDEKGNRTNYETFRDQEIKDVGEEMYLQEYECIFSDELHVLLSWSLIMSCQNERVTTHKTMRQLEGLGRDLFVGIDIGRRHDLTVIWILSRNGDEHTTECVIVLDRAPFPEQEAAIEAVMATNRVAALRVDEQGNGMQLSEHFSTKYPLTAEGVSFTNPNKQTMGGRIKTYMEAKNLWIPDDQEIARDLSSVQRNVTSTGALQLSADRSRGGHADRFWALALALAASASYQPMELGMAL